MAEKIINNPSLLPGDLEIELSGGSIIAISGHPLIGSGGGTQSDYVYYPVFDDTTGNVEFHLGTTASNPQPAGGWHISGATGPAGKDGTDGKDGVSPTVSTSSIPGGNRVTFTYGEGVSTYIDVMSGASGASGAAGASGYSPTITLEPATSTSYPNGGTKITITDLEHQAGQEFYVWNGNDGQGATVNLLEGTGIKIDRVGQDYTIGVSGDYASTSVVEAASANALNQSKTWVGDQGYLTQSDLAGYATEAYAEAASANALSAAKTWVGQQGYLTSVPDSYATKTYANDASANALSEAETWVGQRGYATETYVETASANAYDKAVAQIPSVANFITKDVNNLTYYYKKTETSSTSELSTEFAKYQTKTDMTNYYQKSETSAASELSTEFNSRVKYFSPVTNQYTPGGNDYQHYIDNTQTFNYYKVQVHPYSASPSFSDDGIIHIVLEQQ